MGRACGGHNRPGAEPLHVLAAGRCACLVCDTPGVPTLGPAIRVYHQVFTALLYAVQGCLLEGMSVNVLSGLLSRGLGSRLV